MDDDPLARLRQLCLALPATTERLSHGEPTWFVQGKKTFVTYAHRHHDNRLAFWCAGPPGAQQALVTTDPERFFVPPYVGHRGWLGVWLDGPVDWLEIAALVADAYRQVAPRRLLAALDKANRPSLAEFLASAPLDDEEPMAEELGAIGEGLTAIAEQRVISDSELEDRLRARSASQA